RTCDRLERIGYHPEARRCVSLHRARIPDHRAIIPNGGYHCRGRLEPQYLVLCHPVLVLTCTDRRRDRRRHYGLWLAAHLLGIFLDLRRADDLPDPAAQLLGRLAADEGAAPARLQSLRARRALLPVRPVFQYGIPGV